MADYLRNVRLFSRDARLFLVAVSFHGFSYFGLYALLFNLYLLRLGYGPEFIGLINGAGPLGFAGVSLFAGGLSRRWGSRRIMMIGYSGMVVAFGLLPLAEIMPLSWEASWLVVAYMSSWIGGALVVVNFGPFMMQATTPKERNHAFSVQMALMSLSGFTGNLVGGLLPGVFAGSRGFSLDQPAPYRYPLWLAAILLIPALLAIRATSERGGQQAEEATADGDPIPYGPIFFLALVMLLRTAGEWVVRIFFNAYLDSDLQISTAMIGVLVAVGQGLGVVALAAPFVVGRWGRKRSAGWGMFAMALSVLPLALIAHWLAAGLSFMGLVALVTLTGPAFLVLSQEIVPPQWRSTMAGATSMGLGLGIGGMALGGGYLVAALGYRTLFLLSAGLAVAGGLLFMAYLRVPRGEFARHAPSPDQVVEAV